MAEIETIPLPERETDLGEPFHLEIGDLTAWPGQQFALDFEYNDLRDRWSWRMRHRGTGRDVGGTANLNIVNSFWPYMLVQFVPAPGSDPDGITRRSLRSKVKLAVYPGPDGGDFLPNSGLSDEERERLLNPPEADDFWWYNS